MLLWPALDSSCFWISSAPPASSFHLGFLCGPALGLHLSSISSHPLLVQSETFVVCCKNRKQYTCSLFEYCLWNKYRSHWAFKLKNGRNRTVENTSAEILRGSFLGGGSVFKDKHVEKLISSCMHDTQNRNLDLVASALFRICHTG